MTIPFTRWPEEFARRYREKGYWQDRPLTHILTDHADSDAVAIIDGDRRITYRAFHQSVNNLASALQGAVVKDEDKDGLAWKEYLENVMKKRGSRWLGLYKECKELNQ